MALLEVNDLAVSFVTRNGVNKAVDGISFSVESGKITAIIGESGSAEGEKRNRRKRLKPHATEIWAQNFEAD